MWHVITYWQHLNRCEVERACDLLALGLQNACWKIQDFQLDSILEILGESLLGLPLLFLVSGNAVARAAWLT
jgi:hypothetical protein